MITYGRGWGYLAALSRRFQQVFIHGRTRTIGRTTLVRLIVYHQAGRNMAMPLHIYPRQRLLFSRSINGEMLALHGSGEAIVRLLLETPILYDLSPMTF